MEVPPAALGVTTVAALVVGVAAVGPIGPLSGPEEVTRPVFEFRTALADCEPVDGPDPYPLDEVFADRNRTVKGEWLFIGACLVNGEDETVEEDADGCYTLDDAGNVGVWRRDDEETVYTYSTAPGGTSRAHCHHVPDLPPNTEWTDGRREIAWDLHKDVCPEDRSRCLEDHPDEGERVPGGTYVVQVRYPEHVHEPDWTRTVELPPPS